MIPFADMDYNQLSVEQRRQREQWMAEEAHRLIEARQSTRIPALPTQTNQIYGPGQGSAGRTQEQMEADDAAIQLARRLAQRDQGNWSGGGNW